MPFDPKDPRPMCFQLTADEYRAAWDRPGALVVDRWGVEPEDDPGDEPDLVPLQQVLDEIRASVQDE